jgi:CO/xanthine dehydrogenase FAD-binding subunit
MTRYFAPTTAAEAVSLLAAHEGARVVAGGTDLVVAARGGKSPLPEVLVAIHAVRELARRDAGDSGLRLGPLTTHAWLETSRLVGARWSALADAAALVGSPATRHSGTLGGNLMNASPAMDTGAPLLVFDAEVELSSVRGRRTVRCSELLAGPGRTTAAPDELLTEVYVPDLPAGSGSAYVRHEHRRAMEIAVVGAAAVVTLGPDGLITGARLAAAAVAPTCQEMPDAAAVLVGRPPGEDAFAAAAALAAAAARPISDVRASAAYRRAMTAVVVARALAVAARRAAGRAVPVPANRNLSTATVGSAG